MSSATIAPAAQTGIVNALVHPLPTIEGVIYRHQEKFYAVEVNNTMVARAPLLLTDTALNPTTMVTKTEIECVLDHLHTTEASSAQVHGALRQTDGHSTGTRVRITNPASTNPMNMGNMATHVIDRLESPHPRAITTRPTVLSCQTITNATGQPNIIETTTTRAVTTCKQMFQHLAHDRK